MIDLEQEFQLLMRTVLKQISDKVTSGELTQYEAGQLTTMVNLRMRPPSREEDEGWSPSTQACMDQYAAEDDDGWAGSSRNC